MNQEPGNWREVALMPHAASLGLIKEFVELAGSGKGISFREVAAGRPGKLVQFTLERYKPGADTGSEMYQYNAEEAGIVLKGKLELTVESEVYVLGPGDAYYINRTIGRTASEMLGVQRSWRSRPTPRRRFRSRHCYNAFCCRSCWISSRAMPNSASTTSVCSPNTGGAR